MLVRSGIRFKLTHYLDSALLDAVDARTRQQPGLDRDAVIDEALRLWLAYAQHEAMKAQFAPSPDEDVDPDEWESWRAIQRRGRSLDHPRLGRVSVGDSVTSPEPARPDVLRARPVGHDPVSWAPGGRTLPENPLRRTNICPTLMSRVAARIEPLGE